MLRIQSSLGPVTPLSGTVGWVVVTGSNDSMGHDFTMGGVHVVITGFRCWGVGSSKGQN